MVVIERAEAPTRGTSLKAPLLAVVFLIGLRVPLAQTQPAAGSTFRGSLRILLADSRYLTLLFTALVFGMSLALANRFHRVLADADSLRRQANTVVRLTVVTIVGLIGTITPGFLGMNLLAEAEAPLSRRLAYFALVFGLTAAGVAVKLLLGLPLTTQPNTRTIERGEPVPHVEA